MSNNNLLIRIPSTAIGIAGGALAAYSTVVDGGRKGHEKTKEELAETYTDMYIKNLSSSRASHLLEKVKNYVAETRMDSNFYPFIYGVKNSIIGWTEELIENTPPLVLSAAAIFAPGVFKKHEAKIQPKIDKINKILPAKLKLSDAKTLGVKTSALAAGLLLLGAGYIFLTDVWGVGKVHE